MNTGTQPKRPVRPNYMTEFGMTSQEDWEGLLLLKANTLRPTNSKQSFLRHCESKTRLVHPKRFLTYVFDFAGHKEDGRFGNT